MHDDAPFSYNYDGEITVIIRTTLISYIPALIACITANQLTVVWGGRMGISYRERGELLSELWRRAVIRIEEVNFR